LTFHDLGTSAFHGDNSVSGKLGAFIAAIDSGQIERGSYLLVESIDRLSRDQILKSLNLFTSILTKGLIIVTLSDNKVYTEDSINTLPDLMYSILIMSRAHEESALKGSRVAAAWANKRQRAITENHKLTHKVPSWLQLSGNEFIVLQEQAELVRRIFQMSIDGHGSTAITKQLNHEHVATWGGGDGWHPANIRKLLHSSAVYGEFTPGTFANGKRTFLEPIADYFPAIVSKDMFYQAQHAIKQRTRKGGRPGGTVNIFAALVRCFHCDGPVVRLIRGNKKPLPAVQQKHVFVCDNMRRGRSDCRYKPWDISEFEQKVLTCVKEVNLSVVLGSEQSERVAALHSQLQRGQAQLADAEGRLSRLVALVEQGAHVPSVVQRINELEAEIETLTNQCAITEKEYGLERMRLDTAEIKQADVVQLMTVIGDRDVRVKLKQQLRGLVDRIDVDLVNRLLKNPVL
jgi:DNA invertase Pin-like site-specific DNA recombinase